MAKGAPDPDYILRRDSCPIFSLCFITQNTQKFLVSGNQNGEVSVWDLRTRQVIQFLAAHTGSVLGVIELNDRVITHGRDNRVNIWQKQNARELEKSGHLKCESSGFCKVCVIPTHEPPIIAMPTDSSQINIVHLDTHKKIASLLPPQHQTTPHQNAHGMAMCMSEVSSTSLICGYEDGTAILWNTPESKNLISTLKVFQETVMCICFNKTIGKGVAGSVCNQLKIFTINEQNQQLEVIMEVSITNPGVNCVAFREDGKLFGSGGWDGCTRIFSTKKYNLLAVLTFHASSVQTLCFADDNSLAVGGKDGAISVWSVYK